MNKILLSMDNLEFKTPYLDLLGLRDAGDPVGLCAIFFSAMPPNSSRQHALQMPFHASGAVFPGFSWLNRQFSDENCISAAEVPTA
jgi:hypothetical protein